MLSIVWWNELRLIVIIIEWSIMWVLSFCLQNRSWIKTTYSGVLYWVGRFGFSTGDHGNPSLQNSPTKLRTTFNNRVNKLTILTEHNILLSKHKMARYSDDHWSYEVLRMFSAQMRPLHLSYQRRLSVTIEAPRSNIASIIGKKQYWRNPYLSE